MAGIIAGSVAGWSPIERNYTHDDALFSRATGRSHLENSEEVEVHSGTKPDDQIITENTHNLDAPPSQIEDLNPAAAGPSRQDKD